MCWFRFITDFKVLTAFLRFHSNYLSNLLKQILVKQVNLNPGINYDAYFDIEYSNFKFQLISFNILVNIFAEQKNNFPPTQTIFSAFSML